MHSYRVDGCCLEPDSFLKLSLSRGKFNGTDIISHSRVGRNGWNSRHWRKIEWRSWIFNINRIRKKSGRHFCFFNLWRMMFWLLNWGIFWVWIHIHMQSMIIFYAIFCAKFSIAIESRRFFPLFSPILRGFSPDYAHFSRHIFVILVKASLDW